MFKHTYVLGTVLAVILISAGFALSNSSAYALNKPATAVASKLSKFKLKNKKPSKRNTGWQIPASKGKKNYINPQTNSPVKPYTPPSGPGDLPGGKMLPYTRPSGPGDLPGGKMVPYTPPSGPGDAGGQGSSMGVGGSGYGPYWSDNGTDWTPMGTPPACAEPLTMQPPVDFARVTSILYPGQYRNRTQYKPHGGFRFDNNSDNNISVKIPLDAVLIHGSRYIESGEVQYLFSFVAPCGIMYRFDHLLALTPKFQAIADKFPAGKESDSRTTNVEPAIPVTSGEEIATAIGVARTKNVGFDFGVYDLRKTNAISKNTAWASERRNDPGYRLAAHSICWFDLFPPSAQALRNLPAGDSASGSKSDYCQ